MQIVKNTDKIKKFDKSVVTIGTFDGLHIGHLEILKELNSKAKKYGCFSVVVTFDPHPRTIVLDNYNLKLLTPLEEKIKYFEKLEVDFLYIIKFTKEFSKKTYKNFFNDIIINQVNAKHLILGYDHKFGNDRKGDLNKLVEYTKDKDVEISVVGPKKINGHIVSSTKIRDALLEGNIKEANKMLGKDYSCEGTVEEGSKRGRTIGFPTANISICNNEKLLPKNGVYLVKVVLDSEKYFGLTNIGLRPTFNNAIKPIIEVYIFDFNKNIYGKKIVVHFLERIRDEKKFTSVDELKEKIKEDVNKAKETIKRNFK
ncbi:MAG: riboflavin biosynthesis protein RibF [Ignavibacteriae bacterium]|nr:MAG: riboflavin biosynthesis protein RibF [Ignavibacteriota bacterium]